MLPGRCHKDGWGNGRISLALAEELGVIDRSMILCYEAIEFEPTPPASVLQFDHIRRILKEEIRLAPLTYGVMGNAQQPIMRLPNIYFFARGTWDPSYLDRSDDEVLRDCADFLGGPREELALGLEVSRTAAREPAPGSAGTPPPSPAERRAGLVPPGRGQTLHGDPGGPDGEPHRRIGSH